MATAQVTLNAVSSSSAVKSKAQPVKSDTSFSDILSKENNVATAKGNSRELKANIASEKYSKELDRLSATNADTQAVNKTSNKDETVYNEKDSIYQTDKAAVKSEFTEEPENDIESQDEKVKSLMAILASLIADISRKTGTDEMAVRYYITENNLTSANLLDIDSWKGFVTEVNGLENISAILTNDEAFKNLEDISEIINIHLDEMGQMTTGMTEGVTDEKQVEAAKAIPDKETVSLGEILAKMFDEAEETELIKTREETEVEEAVENKTEEQPVVIPFATNSSGTENANTQAGFEQNGRNLQGNKESALVDAAGASAHNIFENIVENLQKLEETGSLPEGTTAKAILEQVTNQIHNLHAPDKTSLEFMLTPETLGKVAVNVSSKNGVLQAEFRVESAQAKAALESQMAELKLNFENQGLKVANVSVMISENGIGKDDRGRNTGEEGKRQGKRNRSFSLDGDEVIDGILVSPEEAVIAYTDNGTGNNINLGA